MDHSAPTIKLLPPTFSPWGPKRPPSRQVAVLMSGGVDSSVAACLLKRAGWDVLGITMKNPVACAAGARGCCGADAAFVCDDLNLPHYFIDVTDAFDRLIVEPFRRAYSRGRTPNPCVDCNTFLKFSLVWDLLHETFGIPYVATGHYARVVQQEGLVCLRRAGDRSKDQSYFLYGIPARRLSGLLLPLGDLSKQQVRETALAQGLSVADKAESMELCFAGERDYRAALDASRRHCPGEITDMQGKRIGMHQGISNYTIGQRKGIGLAAGKPMYVGRIDPVANVIALGTRDEVMTRAVAAGQINVLVREAVAVGRRVYGKIRSYGGPRPCVIAEVGQDHITVEFGEPQFAPCPGQKLVLYDKKDNLIGGGTIVAS